MRRGVTDEADLSVEALKVKYGRPIREITEKAAGIADRGDFAEIYALRLCLEHKGDVDEALKNHAEVQQWRQGSGKAIVEAAEKAVAAATADGKWNNKPVFDAAPHATSIGKYFTASQIVVFGLPAGDLCSCIRASAINDEVMMKEVTKEQLVEFFIYAREVNCRVADSRTKKTGKLVRLLAANDLTGVSKFPDKAFQEALTESSKQATTLYPGLAGPTVILNLPWLARMLVSFLTPLFPGAVQQRIKFARGPMAYLEDLSDCLKEPTRSTFVSDLQSVLEA